MPFFFNTLRDWYSWKKQEKSFKKFLKNAHILETNLNSEEIFIIVQPWTLAPLPWYMISLAIAYTLYGKRVKIILDNTICEGNSEERFQIKSIQKVLKLLPTTISWQLLSDITVSNEPLPESLNIERLINKNKTIRYRGEIYPPQSSIYGKIIENALRASALRINNLLRDSLPKYIVLGGGGYGLSGVWMEMAKLHKVRVASVDSGTSILLVSTNGIAANLDDIPKAVKLLATDNSPFIIEIAQAELRKRMFGEDQFISQSKPVSDERFDCGIVLPLNQSYDLSALERHQVFKNQTEWMIETARWVIENTNESMIIRRHPVERNPLYLSTDDYKQRLIDAIGDNKRVRFIEANEDVNTYDLIKNAKVVIPYVSTIGTEAAAMGKTVVTEGDSCYSDLGFVWKANTKHEYFELIKKGLSGEISVTEEQRKDAWRCYYLTQCCNWHFTSFTPQLIDFKKWVLEYPKDVLSKTEVVDVLFAIDQNIPLSIIAHRKRSSVAIQKGELIC